MDCAASACPPHWEGTRRNVTSLDIANLLREHGAFGAIAILAVAVVYLYREVSAAKAKHLSDLERIVGIAESCKAAIAASAEALKDNEQAVAAIDKAIGTLAREAEGAATETRHGIAGAQSSLNGIAKGLEQVMRDIRGRAA